eukprot:TRINITY_DN4703_c0_g1_i1.p2 TRINITY_DN4703_c0_g1~~TRINITY_DN4703_c0_g1_i1.p2  ORF type:complete len:133 (-),score=19.50 TRINITY_DN4703_c0_g1_i1:52-408(-)
MSARASHILIKHEESRRLASWLDPEGKRIKATTKEAATKSLEAIIAELKAADNLPAKFAEIAKTTSDCSSGQAGGDLGNFTKGQMQKPFEDATFALGVGEMSGVVHSGSGSHIILRTG